MALYNHNQLDGNIRIIQVLAKEKITKKLSFNNLAGILFSFDQMCNLHNDFIRYNYDFPLAVLTKFVKL